MEFKKSNCAECLKSVIKRKKGAWSNMKFCWINHHPCMKNTELVDSIPIMRQSRSQHLQKSTLRSNKSFKGEEWSQKCFREYVEQKR